MKTKSIHWKMVVTGPGIHREIEGDAKASEEVSVVELMQGTLAAVAKDAKLDSKITSMSLQFSAS